MMTTALVDVLESGKLLPRLVAVLAADDPGSIRALHELEARALCAPTQCRASILG